MIELSLQQEKMNQEKQNNSEIINDFSNLKSDIYFEGVDGKQYVIEYITFYFVNQLFYNGDKEDLPFVADLQSKIEEDADGNQQKMLVKWICMLECMMN